MTVADVFGTLELCAVEVAISMSLDSAFQYAAQLEDPVRADLVESHRRSWARLAGFGTWWTGPERIAIAAASRAAVDCAFCRERKKALSPISVTGAHAGVSGGGSEGLIPEAAIDAVHRIVTDASRLSGTWVEGLAEQGVSDAHYVELLSVVVSVRSIDAFHRAMGLPLEPLPEPTPGSCEPTRRRPPTAEKTDAFVAMLPSRKPPGEDADLFPGPAPYVIRAMSLVPDAVRWLKDLSGAHYLSMEAGQMFDFANGRGPLSRAQTELIAGRVSAVNECFY